MGIFNFSKDAGEETIDAAAANNINASKLIDGIESRGFDIKDLDIEMDGDTVKVWGTAADQATREKILLALGNTQGIANVEDNMTTAFPQPEAKFHTVESGESLSLIAKKYYGDVMKYNSIFEANQPLLSSPDKIYPGQVLRIPNLEN